MIIKNKHYYGYSEDIPNDKFVMIAFIKDGLILSENYAEISGDKFKLNNTNKWRNLDGSDTNFKLMFKKLDDEK